MPDAHAKLSPSAAHRWLLCPGSVALCEGVVDAGSDYADEGTAGHEVFSKVLMGASLDSFVGQKASNGVVITEELVRLLDAPVEWVRSYLQKRTPSALYSEIKLQVGAPAFGISEDLMWGTSDLIITTPDELCVGDLKLGYVDVPVKGNPQLYLYGLGALHATGWMHDVVRFVILQPRTAEEPKEVVISAKELEAWQDEHRKAVLTAVHGGPLVPSEEACRFCKAAGVCPKLREETLALARREFGSLVTLTGPEVADMLEKGAMIENALKSVRAHALKLLEIDPDSVPGWKRVASRKQRAWKVEAATPNLLKKMGVDPFEKVLISPAKAEAQLTDQIHKRDGGTKKAATAAAKDLISTVAEKPEGEPVLVPATDERPALPPVFTKEEIEELDKKELID